MKIAFFTDTYEPQINGVVKSIKSFENILRKKGHEVFVFCPKGSARYDKHVFPIESFSLPTYPEYRVGLPSFDVVDKLKEIKPDVIHVHSPAPVGAIGLGLGKIFKIPVVMTYHTLLTEYFDYVGIEKTNKRVAERFTKWFFRKASLIVTPSESTKSLLKSYGIKTDIIVIPNPLEVSRIRKGKKRKNSKPIVLHVGRLCKEKRIDVVLRSFKKVLQEKEANLIITSDGPYREQLEDIAKNLGIEKNVKFTGYLSGRSLANLYSKADIFVSASDTETQGIVLLEAFASGCPVIVRNAMGFKDYVVDKKNGLLFNDENDLTKKILLLLNNKALRNRLVKNGFETIEDFTISSSSDKIEFLYNDAVKRKQKLSLYAEISYASSLFIGLSQSWFFRKTNMLKNRRFLAIYSKMLKFMSKPLMSRT
jgi:1,2-diacylglycerol 3-alpha-glucosyltransferase